MLQWWGKYLQYNEKQNLKLYVKLSSCWYRSVQKVNLLHYKIIGTGEQARSWTGFMLYSRTPNASYTHQEDVALYLIEAIKKIK